MKKVLLLLLLPVLAIFAHSCETENTGSGSQPEPKISEIVTDYDGKAVSGKPVTLIGTNFSPKASENQVLYGVGLNSTSLRVTESSETHVVFTAPQVSGKQLRVRVSVNGKESNSVVLEFDNSLSEDGPVEPQEDEVDLSAMLAKATVVQVREGIEWIHFEGVWEGQTRNINIV